MQNNTWYGAHTKIKEHWRFLNKFDSIHYFLIYDSNSISSTVLHILLSMENLIFPHWNFLKFRTNFPILHSQSVVVFIAITNLAGRYSYTQNFMKITFMPQFFTPHQNPNMNLFSKFEEDLKSSLIYENI